MRDWSVRLPSITRFGEITGSPSKQGPLGLRVALPLARDARRRLTVDDRFHRRLRKRGGSSHLERAERTDVAMARRLEHVCEDGHLLAAAQRRRREELRLELADDDPDGVAIGTRHVRGDRMPRQRVEQSTRENRGAHARAQFLQHRVLIQRQIDRLSGTFDTGEHRALRMPGISADVLESDVRSGTDAPESNARNAKCLPNRLDIVGHRTHGVAAKIDTGGTKRVAARPRPSSKSVDDRVVYDRLVERDRHAGRASKDWIR